MSDLPDEFECTITNWEYIYGLCRDVADGVKAAEFEPDVVVARPAAAGSPAAVCVISSVWTT